MSKENNQKNSGKINFESNSNVINIINPSTSLNNTENYDLNEFKESNGKINWKQQNTHHLKPDIERVWGITQKFGILSLINNQGHYPLIFTKGNSTNKLGNIFHGNFFGNFPFVAKVNKITDYPEFKKIEWLFFIRKKYYMSIKLELFKVSEDNSTTLLRKYKFEKQELFNELNESGLLGKIKIFNIIEKLLENEPINLAIYESGLINGRMEDIWDILTDFNKLAGVAPNNHFPSNINLKELNKGEKVEFSHRDNNILQEFILKLECKESKPGWNKWLIILTCFKKGSDIPDETLLIQLTKISNSLCQLTLINKHFKAKNADEFRNISKKIKYIILSIKDYFDNFFSSA